MSGDQKFTDSQKTLTWSFPFCSQRTRSTRYIKKCLFKEITEKIEAFLGEINDNIDRHDGIWLTRFFVNMYMNENMSRVFKYIYLYIMAVWKYGLNAVKLFLKN